MKTYPRLVSTYLAILITSGVVLISSGCSGTTTRESTGEYIDNSAITARVKAAFASDEVVKARQINVDTFRGVVQLSGFVDTTAEKQRAGYLASKVQGVTDVKNNITVK
jgi:hyperosmotically inducible periplasmic protein